MNWNSTLENWKNAKPLSYPSNLKTPFLWRTSVFKDNGESKFKQEFIKCPQLDLKQNYYDFQEHINKSTDKYVTSFYNLSGDTVLVVPIPKKNKNFSNLKNFIDHASKTQQKYFWEHVSEIINLQKKNHQHLWISTHGLAVPYLHVRISTSPKYYGNRKLASPNF
jgi:hypothetical protein